MPVRGHALYGVCGRSGSIIDAFGLIIETAITATTLSDVVYDLPTSLDGTPVAVGQVLLSNNTSQNQVSTAVVDYALEHSSSWSITAGVSIGVTVGTEFKVKAGIPFVVGGEATATASVTVIGTFSYTYGQVNTERKGFQARVQADVAAGETVIATLTTNAAMFDEIPFTAMAMVVYADGTQSARLPISGEFTGVSQYSLSVDYEIILS